MFGEHIQSVTANSGYKHIGNETSAHPSCTNAVECNAQTISIGTLTNIKSVI